MRTVIYCCDRCKREIPYEKDKPRFSPLISLSLNSDVDAIYPIVDDEELCPECYAKYKAIMKKAKEEWRNLKDAS